MTSKVRTFYERLFSTIVLLVLLGGVVALDNTYGYALLICLFCNLASLEWFHMLRGHSCNRGLALCAGLAYPWIMAAGVLFCNGAAGKTLLLGGEENAVTVFVYFPFREAALSLLVLYTLVVFFCELYRMDYKGVSGPQALSSAGITLLSFIYPVWLFSFALNGLSNADVTTLLWLVLVTKMSDLWAYVSGLLAGGRLIKRRFSPTVSPKKTWEGIIGSFLLTSACAWMLRDMAHFSLEWSDAAFFLVLMPTIFLLSVAGDLAGSLIKRGLAVKDSGSLLPGIGGIFDLIDSPAFTVSFFTAVLALF